VVLFMAQRCFPPPKPEAHFVCFLANHITDRLR